MARLAFVLLVALLAVVCNAEETVATLRRGDTAAVEEDASEDHRQLFGWFSSLLFHLGVHPVDCCKPQPPIGPAHHEWGRICPDLGCQTSSSSSSSESTETYSAEASSSASSEAATSSGGSAPTSAAAVSYWPLAVAALAATTALVAGVLGQRREKVGNHQLRGSVARRMDLFSNFADRALSDAKGVEMTSKDDYRLA